MTHHSSGRVINQSFALLHHGEAMIDCCYTTMHHPERMIGFSYGGIHHLIYQVDLPKIYNKGDLQRKLFDKEQKETFNDYYLKVIPCNEKMIISARQPLFFVNIKDYQK